jgi:GGDEF domain-containing protein
MEEPSIASEEDPARFILDPIYDLVPSAPYAGTVARHRAALGHPEAAAELLAAWQGVDLGDPGGARPFPWWTSFYHIDRPRYAADPSAWRPWRADDAKLPFEPLEFERRHFAPVANAECAAALLEWSRSSDDRLAAPARALWKRLEPRVGGEFASNVPAFNPWLDSLALWLLTNRPLLLDAMQPLALAIATRLAAFARRRGGKVVGQRFPFHEKFLVSATAQLASSLLVLGQDLDLAAELVSAAGDERAADGSWSDAKNPPDIMTTLVAADLLLDVDPGFDPGPTRSFFSSRRNARGTWTAFGPEEPWITAEILRWHDRARVPLTDRFRWPRIAPHTRDHKLSLPNYSWFEQVADLFARISTLSDRPMTAAFVDLARFGTFNNRFGQDMGDEVLRKFAAHLTSALPGGRACRDGGDEFLVIGTPCGTRLETDLEAMRASWPAAFHAAFGDDVPSVAPRVVTVACRCGQLRDARRELGRSIAGLKARHPNPPERGVVLELERLPG